MNDRLSYRYGQLSSINYVLVMDEQPKTFSFIPPAEFHNNVIRFISSLPKDILQMSESLSYFETTLRSGLNDPYHFHVKYSENLEEYLTLMPKERIYLFFVDSKSIRIEKVIKLLSAFHCDLRYYCFINDKDRNFTKLPNEIQTPGHFMQQLYEKQEEIFRLIGVPYRLLAPEVAIGWSGYYDFPLFIPAQSNYRLANSITGNFDYGERLNGNDTPSEEQVRARAKVAEAAHANAKSFTRQQQIIEQLDKIDFFSEICFDEGLVKQVHEIEPVLTPLIIIAPFQNPDVQSFLNENSKRKYREYFSTFNFEQTQNYIHLNKPPKSASALLLNSRLISLKTQFLDDIAFLHSSFTFSPMVRLPAQGKTLYRHLSFFRTEVAGRLTAPNNRTKVLKTIQSFGQEFRRRAMSPELIKRLTQENRQIVAISDLPVEWVDVSGVPLGFTHDVCRLPETALHGLMANFVAHEQNQYIVPKDILKKTLVVFGNNEPSFRWWHPAVRMVAEKNGVIIKECLSIEALKVAVEEVKPHLLIIDSHGAYDSESKSSVLFFGKEKLSGDQVVEFQISAPLVFLSACSTAPTYGTIDTIANAFFEVGALSVTTTYLPISVDSGSILYIRILNNLATASSSPIHQNWLAFIAHLLRTSAVDAAYKRHAAKHSRNPDASAEAQANDYTYMLSFYERRKIYERLLKGEGPSLIGSTPEFLFYSILGRADLIKFQSWTEEFEKKNDTKATCEDDEC